MFHDLLLERSREFLLSKVLCMKSLTQFTVCCFVWVERIFLPSYWKYSTFTTKLIKFLVHNPVHIRVRRTNVCALNAFLRWIIVHWFALVLLSVYSICFCVLHSRCYIMTSRRVLSHAQRATDALTPALSLRRPLRMCDSKPTRVASMIRATQCRTASVTNRR